MIKAAAPDGLARRARAPSSRLSPASSAPAPTSSSPTTPRTSPAGSSRTPRFASRKDGAAIPLDETDKQLLNLLQGRFPIDRRPFERIADAAGSPRTRCCAGPSACSTSASSARSRRSSTRARSATSRCSSPPRSTPRTRSGRRSSSTRTPASPTTTCATTTSTCGSRSPSSRTRRSACTDARGPARKTGAESIRQLPDARSSSRSDMDLEMVEGTDALAVAAEAAQPLELDLIELREEDIARHPRDPGQRCRWSPSRTRPPPSASASARTSSSPAWSRSRSARRCAASPRSSSTAAPASPPTAWASGRCRTDRVLELGAPDGRHPRHQRTATSGRPTRTGRTRCSRWPTGARRRSATRSSTRSPRRRGIHERATLYSSTEYKKVRMIYFTDALPRVGARARRCLARHLLAQRHQVAELYRARGAVLPGGVNSPVRAMRAIGARPDVHRPRARAPRSATSTATATSTTCARGAR